MPRHVHSVYKSLRIYRSRLYVPNLESKAILLHSLPACPTSCLRFRNNPKPHKSMPGSARHTVLLKSTSPYIERRLSPYASHPRKSRRSYFSIRVSYPVAVLPVSLNFYCFTAVITGTIIHSFIHSSDTTNGSPRLIFPFATELAAYISSPKIRNTQIWKRRTHRVGWDTMTDVGNKGNFKLRESQKLTIFVYTCAWAEMDARIISCLSYRYRLGSDGGAPHRIPWGRTRRGHDRSASTYPVANSTALRKQRSDVSNSHFEVKQVLCVPS